MWLDAAAQILYSFSLSFGGIITMSAGNDIHNNCQKDAILLGVSNCATCIYAGIVVFSIMGFKVSQWKIFVIHNIETTFSIVFWLHE